MDNTKQQHHSGMLIFNNSISQYENVISHELDRVLINCRSMTITHCSTKCSLSYCVLFRPGFPLSHETEFMNFSRTTNINFQLPQGLNIDISSYHYTLHYVT